MQEKETTKYFIFSDVFRVPTTGRLLALDLGTKKVGVAVSDEFQFTVRHVRILERKGWKQFLKEVINYLNEFDAKALVIGLPYKFDGSESEMSAEARRVARNFRFRSKFPFFFRMNAFQPIRLAAISGQSAHRKNKYAKNWTPRRRRLF